MQQTNYLLSMKTEEIVMNPLVKQSIGQVFQSFLAGNLKNPLIFLFGRSGTGKNLIVRHLAHKHGLNIHCEKYFDAQHHKKAFSPDDYFNLAISSRLPDKKSIIVLQNLPSRQHLSLKATQTCLQQHCQRPTVLLILVCNQSLYYPKHIYQLFGQEIISSCLVINFKQYTDSQIKQILNQYLEQVKEKAQDLGKNSLFEEITDSALGDARQAIMALEWRLATNSMAKQKKKDNVSDIFHLVAKFLYNKRLVKGNKKAVYLSREELLKKDNQIYFDIQEVINVIVLSGIRFDLFIQHHVLDYYHNVKDLACFYDQLVFSDIHQQFYWQHRFQDFSSQQDTHFNTHQNYLLLGYATMLSNLDGNKVPKQFRSLGRNQHQQQLESILPDTKLVLRQTGSDLVEGAQISIRDLVLHYTWMKKIDKVVFKKGRIQLHSSVGEQVQWQKSLQRQRIQQQKKQAQIIREYQEEDPSDIE